MRRVALCRAYYAVPVTAAFIGIDIAIAKRKHLPLVVSTLEGDCLIPRKLRHLDVEPPRGCGNVAVLDAMWRRTFAHDTRDYILEVCRLLGLTPERIAIDAPSSPCRPSL